MVAIANEGYQIEKNDPECSSANGENEFVVNGVPAVTEIKIIDTKELEAVSEKKNADDISDRGGWGSKIEFILAVVGFAVGLGNIWRFPYLVQRHGGGAFLIPYILCIFILAIPIFFLELSLGQRHSKGPLHLWNKLCKPLAGIGLGSMICSWFVTVYYQMIVGWCFYYFFISFHSSLPYASCPCIGGVCNETNPQYVTECLKSSPTSYFWYRSALNISDSIEDSGHFNWKLFLCLLLAWVIVYAINWKGLAIMGKVVYFTTCFPYVVLLIFLIRAFTLDGALDGIKHMFYPQFDKLLLPETWLVAFSQVFLSNGLAQGTIITYSSYNDIHNNIRKDAFLISLINSGTSIIAGVTIFGVLGYKAEKKYVHCLETNVFDVWAQNATVCDKTALLNEVAQGPGLTFIAFTEAISTMKCPQLWSVLFFVMILSLGIGTNVGQIEPLRTTLCDLKILPFRGEFLTLIMCSVSFLVGVLFCQGSGEYWLQMFDSYTSTFGLLAIAFFEIIVAIYIYGIEKIKEDIVFMIGKVPGLYWTICWRFTGPALILLIFGASAYKVFAGGITYTSYDAVLATTVTRTYPIWGKLFCCFLLFSSIITIPLGAVLVKFGLFRFSRGKSKVGRCTFNSDSSSSVVDVIE